MIEPYKDILIFIVVLFAANFFWKLTIAGEESGGPVHWLGLDITAPFDFMCEHIVTVVSTVIGWFSSDLWLRDSVTMIWDTGNSIRIVWGCTAIKQSFIWLIIMIFTRGDWKHKLWFIPLGWLVAYAFNILRILLITLIVHHHPEQFELFHAYIFKYLFYGILFLLWVIWNERMTAKRLASE